MPRQSRGPASSAPRRPVAAPPAPAARATPPQTRPASTAAHPPAQAPPQAQPQQSGGSGLFGQMASTAAGVAVGSSIGHAIGGFFGGGSSAAPAAPADQPVAQTQDGQYAMNQNYDPPAVCANEVKGFRQCMDQNGGDLTICGWYLDQLKGCQQAASRY
ncbi:hypothetical protein EJ03DRAFT_370806 [Teratosphaeria nubilosa]|uniref:CHCH domain-containing protein n=1 Tax=Teratosphaeria nubilosa TaxID=161662 RepID=A0A6G1LM82_9PEZI|nr:hypothetical protein EJ03DRAFT_370806 [Teratosphaeria nubilosa]